MRCMFGKNIVKSAKRENCENSMKTIVTIIMLCGVLGGYAQTTPRFAASTKTWTVGKQTWSDAIRIPECNKNSYRSRETDPECCSYAKDGNTRYYYNWRYVQMHATHLCPAPWRVPDHDDFCTLFKPLTGQTTSCDSARVKDSTVCAALWRQWGAEFGGEVQWDNQEWEEPTIVYSIGGYRAYTPYKKYTLVWQYDLNYHLCGMIYEPNTKAFQVRCVK